MCKNINKCLTKSDLCDTILDNMEIYNRAVFQSPESATEWVAKADCVGILLHANLGFAGA
jgi:hypothetical protein